MELEEDMLHKEVQACTCCYGCIRETKPYLTEDGYFDSGNYRACVEMNLFKQHLAALSKMGAAVQHTLDILVAFMPEQAW